MEYTIETSHGFVLAFRTICGELNEVTEYTDDITKAYRFSEKRLKALRARSFFRYHSMTVIIAAV